MQNTTYKVYCIFRPKYQTLSISPFTMRSKHHLNTLFKYKCKCDVGLVNFTSGPIVFSISLNRYENDMKTVSSVGHLEHLGPSGWCTEPGRPLGGATTSQCASICSGSTPGALSGAMPWAPGEMDVLLVTYLTYADHSYFSLIFHTDFKNGQMTLRRYMYRYFWVHRQFCNSFSRFIHFNNSLFYHYRQYRPSLNIVHSEL